MAKDRRKLLHIHSSVPDKQPTAASLEVGEIAVNNAKDQEFLSLKNSDDKVVRFSSDGQIIDWIEKKEVMPYSGAVDNVHLDTNRSNIEIKLNQVAASNTVKHDVVNGATDIDGDLVNPTDDGGLTNGAGFAIDMSQYAMIGANPSFSSITVTHRSNLSGATNISNGAGGSVLNITTTDVNANDTNWAENITNKIENITSRTTQVGTENITVTGTTTEVHNGDVDITNNSNKAETTKGDVIVTVSGTTTENNGDDVLINNNSDYVINTSGKAELNSTGNTCINSEDTAALYGKVVTNVGLNCSSSASAATTNVYGTTIKEKASTAETTIGTATTNITAATTTISVSNTTASTATLSGNTLTIDESASISAKTPSAYISGTSLNIKEDNTDVTSCGQINLTTNELNIKQCEGGSGSAEFKFCDGFKVDSNDIILEECENGGSITIDGTNAIITVDTASTTINSAKTDINTATTNITAATTTIGTSNEYITNLNEEIGTEAKHVSGNTTTNVNGNTTINTTGVTSISSQDNVCITSQKDADLYGKDNTKVGVACDGSKTTNATIESTGTTNVYGPTVNVSGSTTNVTGSTSVNVTGSTVNVDANDYDLDANNVCVSATTKANFYGVETNIGVECGGSVATSTTVEGSTVNISGNTTNVTGSTNVNINGNDICISGGTEASFGAETVKVGTNCDNNTITKNVNIYSTSAITTTSTTVNTKATTVNVTASTENHSTNSFNVSTSAACINASDTVTVGGDVNTYVGSNCEGSPISNNTYIYGDTINNSGETISVSANTENIKVKYINQSGSTYNVTATTNISGDTTINGNTNITKNINVTCNTNITGNTTIGGDLKVNIPCDGITADTVNKALCELLTRGEVTMEKITPESTSEILATYRLFQNGNQIGEDINIPKDHLLKNAEIKYGILNGTTFTDCTAASTDCHWYIKLVWNVFDPSTGHADDKITYMPADDFVKDIDSINPSDNGTALNHNVKVTVWYDGEQNHVSAETTPTMHVHNLYATANVSGATVSGTTIKGNTGNITTLNAGNTSVSGNVGISGDTEINGLLNPKKGLSKKLSWKYDNVRNAASGETNFSADTSFTIPKDVNDIYRNKIKFIKGTFSSSTTYDSETLTATYDPGSGTVNTDRDITIYIPTAASEIGRGTLKVKHNGLDETFDPAGDSSWTLPHSALTISYDATSGKSGSVTYNTSGAVSAYIPTKVSHLENDLKYLKWDLGTPSADTTGYNGSIGKTITIPSKTSDLNPESLTIDYGVDVTSKSDDTYDTSAAKTVSIPTSVSHINRGKLTVNHNGLSDTFDPASNSTMTFPHSGLTICYEATSGKSGCVTYNTSGAISASIPTEIAHLNRGKLTLQKNSTTIGTYDPASDETINMTFGKFNVCYSGTPNVCDLKGTCVDYDTTTEKEVIIPVNVSQLGRATLEYKYGATSGKSASDNGTYDPGEYSVCSGMVSDTIVIPTSVCDLNRGTLTIKQNGSAIGTYDPCSNKEIDIAPYNPSGLSICYGSTCGLSGCVDYGTSGFTVPATISDVTCGDITDTNPGTSSNTITAKANKVTVSGKSGNLTIDGVNAFLGSSGSTIIGAVGTGPTGLEYGSTVYLKSKDNAYVESDNIYINSNSGITINSNSGDIEIKGYSTNYSGGNIDISAGQYGNVNINGLQTHINSDVIKLRGQAGISIDASNSVCVNAGTMAQIYGSGKTIVGVACNGNVSDSVEVKGKSSIDVSSTTIVDVYANSALTLASKNNVEISASGTSGTVNVSAAGTDGTIDVYANSALTLNSGDILIDGDRKVTVSGKSIFSNSVDKTSIQSRGVVNIGGISEVNIGYDSGGTDINTNSVYIGSSNLSQVYSDKKVEIQVSGSAHATFERNSIRLAGNTTINGDLSVSGTITANGAIYSSDINLKENIRLIEEEKANRANAVRNVAFNFKDDESKRTVYGVIAQDVESAGLGELVHIKEDGTKGVDYTSLLILKIEALYHEIDILHRDIRILEKKIDEKSK